jgi:hypothetical protein
VGQVEVGMAVVSIDGEVIGHVKEVGETEFLLDRPLAHDLYVPYRFVLAMREPGERVRGGPHQSAEVMLNISAANIDAQGWRRA